MRPLLSLLNGFHALWLHESREYTLPPIVRNIPAYNFNFRSPVLVLIFNQESPRDTVYLLRILHRELCQNYSLRLDHVIFCTNSVYANGNDPVGMLFLSPMRIRIVT